MNRSEKAKAAPLDRNAIIEECVRVVQNRLIADVAAIVTRELRAIKRTAPQEIGKEASQAQGSSPASQPSVDGPDSQLRPAVAARSGDEVIEIDENGIVHGNFPKGPIRE